MLYRILKEVDGAFVDAGLKPFDAETPDAAQAEVERRQAKHGGCWALQNAKAELPSPDEQRARSAHRAE